MNKVMTAQVGNRLIIADGSSPLRYVDLKTNKVHQFKPLKKSVTPQVVSTCLWYDGTYKPRRGHIGLCEWNFDGQVWRHL